MTTALGDAGLLVDEVGVSKELGFGGKLCIHPSQVAIVNDALRPSREELAWARRIVELAGVDGVSVVDGEMVDAPVLARAAAVLRHGSAAECRQR